jgi:hypothetical protein
MRMVALARAVGCFLASSGVACGSDSDAAPPLQFDASLVDVTHDVGSDVVESGSDASQPDTGTPFEGPTKLSETGLYQDIATRTLRPEIRAFDVRYPLWADGATKQRYLLLPAGQQIDTSDMDVWKFPIGTKAWKEFYEDGKLIETRLLWKQEEGADGSGWLKVAYLWNEDGTEAFAVPEGVANANGTTHDVPAIEGCEQCHNGAGDVLVGVAAIQLSKETGGGYLSTLIADGVLSNPPAGEFAVPGGADIENAIGYFHGNCGQCHNNQSFLAQKLGLRLKLLTGISTPEETPVYQTTIGKPAKHRGLGGTTYIVVPGKPDESQLFYRISVRDLDQMPPLGTESLDPTGIATIAAWIDSLPP